MDSLNIFDLSESILRNLIGTTSNQSTSIWHGLTLPEQRCDICIKINDGTIFYAQKIVLQQLKFFESIFEDQYEMEYTYNSDREAIAIIPIQNDYLDNYVFYLLYARLKNNLLSDKKKENIPILYDSLEQIKYINLIDYLTDPCERNGLLSSIEWTDVFWVMLITRKFQNLDTFFNKGELSNGYELSAAFLNSRIKLTKNQFSELGVFFGIDYTYILKVAITQFGAIKEILRNISHFASNCSITFISTIETLINDDDTENKNAGIYISKLSDNISDMVNFYLDASKFKTFFCVEQKISFDINIQHFDSLLRSANDGDDVCLYITSEDRSLLHVKMNTNKGDIMRYHINIIEVDREVLFPKTIFEPKLTIDSHKFYTMFRRLHKSSVLNLVEIFAINNKITFQNHDNSRLGTCTFTYNIAFPKTEPCQLISGLYYSNGLMIASKYNKFCNSTIEIYLENDFPLMLVISVGTIGKGYFQFGPVTNTVEKIADNSGE